MFIGNNDWLKVSREKKGDLEWIKYFTLKLRAIAKEGQEGQTHAADAALIRHPHPTVPTKLFCTSADSKTLGEPHSTGYLIQVAQIPFSIHEARDIL